MGLLKSTRRCSGTGKHPGSELPYPVFEGFDFLFANGYVFGIDDKAEVGNSLLSRGDVGLLGVDGELQFTFQEG